MYREHVQVSGILYFKIGNILRCIILCFIFLVEMFYHIGHFISMFHSGPLSTEEHNGKYGRDHLHKKRRLQANRAKVLY